MSFTLLIKCNLKNIRCSWLGVSVILALGRAKQGDCQFETHLDYTASFEYSLSYKLILCFTVGKNFYSKYIILENSRTECFEKLIAGHSGMSLVPALGRQL